MNINVNFSDASAMIAFLNAVGVENVNLSLGGSALPTTEQAYKPVEEETVFIYPSKTYQEMSKLEVLEAIRALNPSWDVVKVSDFDKPYFIETLRQMRRESPYYHTSVDGRIIPKQRSATNIKRCAAVTHCK